MPSHECIFQWIACSAYFRGCTKKVQVQKYFRVFKSSAAHSSCTTSHNSTVEMKRDIPLSPHPSTPLVKLYNYVLHSFVMFVIIKWHKQTISVPIGTWLEILLIKMFIFGQQNLVSRKDILIMLKRQTLTQSLSLNYETMARNRIFECCEFLLKAREAKHSREMIMATQVKTKHLRNIIKILLL